MELIKYACPDELYMVKDADYGSLHLILYYSQHERSISIVVRDDIESELKAITELENKAIEEYIKENKI